MVRWLQNAREPSTAAAASEAAVSEAHGSLAQPRDPSGAKRPCGTDAPRSDDPAGPADAIAFLLAPARAGLSQRRRESRQQHGPADEGWSHEALAHRMPAGLAAGPSTITCHGLRFPERACRSQRLA